MKQMYFLASTGDQASDGALAPLTTSDFASISPSTIGLQSNPAFGAAATSLNLNSNRNAPDRINPNGSWSFSWGNAAHTTADAVYTPSSSTNAELLLDAQAHEAHIASSGGTAVYGMNGVQLIDPNATFSQYLGVFNMVGSCSVGLYTAASSGAAMVVVQGSQCAAALQTQEANGNLYLVLGDISYAQAGEMDAMSGGLAGIGNQIAPMLGSGSATESTGAASAGGWNCSGESGSSWGNGDTFTCESGGPNSVVIRLPTLAETGPIFHH